MRRSKIRTLLPPIRNITLFFLVMLAVFMTLSTLGVEIGPLIASAGVVGVAIGFGAQTLFKDMISGMFYLMDDAFRIGEYIVAGDYRGTVNPFRCARCAFAITAARSTPYRSAALAPCKT